MTFTLEDRLMAAAEQLDRQIDREVFVDTSSRSSQARTVPVSVALAVCAATFSIAGLFWVAGDDRDSVIAPGGSGAVVSPATTPDATPPSDTRDLPAGTEVPATDVPVDTVTGSAVSGPFIPPPLAIGESVMLAAAEELQAGGFMVNVDVARLGRDQLEVLRQLSATGQVGEIVVVQAGTNGPVDVAVFDDIMTVLADVGQVVFLTVHAPGKGYIAANNALILGLPDRYPNVTVLDWHGLAASGQLPGLSGDGVHLATEAAQQFYANYVFSVIGRNDLVLPLPD